MLLNHETVDRLLQAFTRLMDAVTARIEQEIKEGEEQ